MRWLLAGYCGLALISISVCSKTLKISQTPRYVAAQSWKWVSITCLWPKEHQNVTVEWFKAAKYSESKNKIKVRGRISSILLNGRSTLDIQDVQGDDSGIFYCLVNGVWGPGTGVHVGRLVDHARAQHRTQMKDILIVLQGLLLAMCIGATLLRHHKMQERRDCIYEEPVNDHIYEGLMIETCGGGLYEDLTLYAQPEGAEAPWE